MVRAHADALAQRDGEASPPGPAETGLPRPRRLLRGHSLTDHAGRAGCLCCARPDLLASSARCDFPGLPPTLKFKLDQPGQIMAEPMNLLAADVREKGDGRGLRTCQR